MIVAWADQWLANGCQLALARQWQGSGRMVYYTAARCDLLSVCPSIIYILKWLYWQQAGLECRRAQSTQMESSPVVQCVIGSGTTRHNALRRRLIRRLTKRNELDRLADTHRMQTVCLCSGPLLPSYLFSADRANRGHNGSITRSFEEPLYLSPRPAAAKQFAIDTLGPLC